MNNKLQAKDLITVGIYTAIYFVVYFACGMLGYIPIFMVLLGLICSFFGGIPFMLYTTKIKKFGMITITGLICGILMALTGMSWPPIILGPLCGFFADLVLKSGGYKSSKKSILAYGVFSIWITGMYLPLYMSRDSYFEAMIPTYGQEYVDKVMSYTPNWTLALFAVMGFVGGILGGLLGRAILKKHFVKAGMV